MKTRSKLVLEKIDDMKTKMVSKVMGRKSAKKKVNIESSINSANLAKTRNGGYRGPDKSDDRSQGTSKMTETMMVRLTLWQRFNLPVKRLKRVTAFLLERLRKKKS